jgi:hypothetical protein
MTFTLAAQLGRIAYRTLRDWMVRGETEEARQERGEPLYDENKEPIPDVPNEDGSPNAYEIEAEFLQFYRDVTDASASADLIYFDTMDKSARNDPFWAERMVRLRHPELYGGGNGKQPIAINIDAGRDGHAQQLGDGKIQDDNERYTNILIILRNAGEIVEGEVIDVESVADTPDDEVYPYLPNGKTSGVPADEE